MTARTPANTTPTLAPTRPAPFVIDGGTLVVDPEFPPLPLPGLPLLVATPEGEPEPDPDPVWYGGGDPPAGLLEPGGHGVDDAGAMEPDGEPGPVGYDGGVDVG